MADIIINVPGTGTTGMGQPIAQLLKNTCSGKFELSYIEPEDSPVIINFIEPSDGDYNYLYITVPPNDSAISGRTMDITMHYISDGPGQVDFRVCQTNNTDTLSS